MPDVGACARAVQRCVDIPKSVDDDDDGSCDTSRRASTRPAEFSSEDASFNTLNHLNLIDVCN